MIYALRVQPMIIYAKMLAYGMCMRHRHQPQSMLASRTVSAWIVCMPYLQNYYADSFKQEAVAATMDRMTKWRDATLAALLAVEEEADYVGSSEEMDASESEDAATDAGQHGEPMAVDVPMEEEELYDDVPDELKW